MPNLRSLGKFTALPLLMAIASLGAALPASAQSQECYDDCYFLRWACVEDCRVWGPDFFQHCYEYCGDYYDYCMNNCNYNSQTGTTIPSAPEPSRSTAQKNAMSSSVSPRGCAVRVMVESVGHSLRSKHTAG